MLSSGPQRPRPTTLRRRHPAERRWCSLLPRRLASPPLRRRRAPTAATPLPRNGATLRGTASAAKSSSTQAVLSPKTKPWLRPLRTLRLCSRRAAGSSSTARRGMRARVRVGFLLVLLASLPAAERRTVTTGQLVARLIKPATRRRRCRFAELPGMRGNIGTPRPLSPTMERALRRPCRCSCTRHQQRRVRGVGQHAERRLQGRSPTHYGNRPQLCRRLPLPLPLLVAWLHGCMVASFMRCMLTIDMLCLATGRHLCCAPVGW